MKKRIVVLIFLALLISFLRAEDYNFLTDEEILAYLKYSDQSEIIEDIRNIDWIEGANPIVGDIEFATMLDKSGNLYIWLLQPISIQIAYLYYKLTLPAYKVVDFAPPVRDRKLLRKILFPIVTGTCAVFGTAITGEDKGWKYFVSGIVGGTIGFLVSLI